MKLPIEAIQENNTAVDDIESRKELSVVDNNTPIGIYGAYSMLEYMEDDTKAKVKYIRYLEKIARGSQELRNYIRFLKENLDLTKCSILNGVDAEGAKIELHHFPFTLYDIARFVLEDSLQKKEDVSSFELVQRIVRLHYEGKVGLIPLCQTVHQLVHAGKIALSLKSVYGKWQELARQYWHVLSEDDKSALEFLVKTSITPSSEGNNFRKLRIKVRQIIENKSEETDDTNMGSEA